MSDGNIYDSILDAAPSQNPQKSLTVNPRQPAPSVYDGLLDRQDEQENQRLMESIARSAGKNADVEAEAQRLGFKTGVGPDIARNNMEEVRRRAAIVDIQQRRLQSTSPVLARQLTDPNFAAIAHDQIDNLSTTEKVFKWFSDIPKDVSEQWEAGNLEYRLGVLGQRAQTGQANKREWQEINNIRGRLRNLSDDSTFLGGASRILGQMSNTLPQALAFGAATSGVFAGGAALAGQAGPQVLTPEEIITVPGAAVAGFKVGTTYKMAEQAYQLESGLSYLDMVDSGIDKATAQWASAGVGVINAGLEMVSFGVAATPFKRLLNKAIGEEISQALVRPTVSQAVTGALRTYGTTILTEAGTESLQEFVSFIGEDLGRTFSKNELETKITTEEGRAELASRMGDVFVKTAMGMAVLGVPGAAVQFRSDIGRAQQATRAEQFFTDLSENAADSAVRNRNPAAYEQFIAAQAEGGRAENIFVDANEMANVLRQSRITDADLNRVMPGMAEQLAGAIQTGSDVIIPTAQFAARVAGTDLGNAMVPHMRLDPAAMSAAEAKQFEGQKEQLKAEAQAVLDAKLETDKAFTESAKRVRDIMYTQLKETKTMPAKAAQLNADFVRDFVVTQAAKLKMQPEEFYNRYMYKVETARQGAAKADLFDQQGNVRTESQAFKNWFRAGKIVDQEGRPTVVYHGTTREITRFERAPGVNGQIWGTGYYLTRDPKYAASFAKDFTKTPAEEDVGGNVLPLYVALQNPLTDAQELTDIKREVGGDADAITAEAKARGYDGIDVSIGGRNIIVAFDATDIKSVNNAGDWSRESAELLAQRGKEQVEGRAVLDAVDAVANVASTFEFASTQKFKTNRDFKLAIQKRVLDAAKASKVDLSDFTRQVEKYLVRIAIQDAITALETNPNAVGWYNDRVTKALSILSLVHPEIATDPQAKFAFTWALAVTSNGLKVDKNFELAEQVYRRFKETGTMPTDIQAGQAQIAINGGLQLYNDLVAKYGLESVIDFMTTRHTVKEVVEYTGKNISGENLTTEVYGAAALGPKIGNGFFANLYGHFEQLTVDRWFMRTWGRWTGTLITENKANVKLKQGQIKAMIQAMSPADKKAFEQIIKVKLQVGRLDQVAEAINKASMKPENRKLMAMIGAADDVAQAKFDEIFGPATKGTQRISYGDELRKVGNALVKYLDGQKEQPSGPPERGRIRKVMGQALTSLQQQYPALTMSDLQALLWYPEKRLYDSAKTADEATTGYEDDEAPDYANAAAALAAELGVSQDEINTTIQEVDNELRTQAAERAGRAERGAGDGILRQAAQREEGTVIFEVAPDPNDAELTQRWNDLGADERIAISEAIAEQIVPSVLDATNATGEMLTQVGSYQEFTNPSFAVKLTSGNPMDVAKALGFVLSQDSMMVVAAEKFEGSFQAGAITIEIGDKLETEVDRIYQTLRSVEGVPQIQGQTTTGGNMVILLDEGMDAKAMADAFDQALDGEFGIVVHNVAAAFPEKQEYDYASADSEPTGNQSLARQRYRDARAEAGRLVDRAISEGIGAIASEPVGGPGVGAASAEDLAARSRREAAERAGQLAQPARGGFDPKRLTTILNEKADLSTFLHETAHFFLTVYADMAAMPDATDQMKTDMQTVLDWFGIADLDTWNKMSLEEQRKYHEQWAYNYEVYLFEGKAPSVEMQSMFDKFSSWLKRVYLSIREDLNRLYREEHDEDLPILTGEVRQVMDRMVASDDQIKRAEAVRSMEGLFQTKEQSGMDDAAWIAYQAMLDEAREAATIDLTKASLRQMQWLSNAKSRLLKEMQAKHDTLRKEVRTQVEEEIKGEDVYKAIEFLKYGRVMDQDGNPIEVLQGNKLNLAEVKVMFPASKEALVPAPDFKKLGYGKYGMLSETGLSPDLVASMFGFTSGEALVNALLDAKPIKEEIDMRTDMRMLDEHGAMNTQAELEFEVEKALHNEARARFVAVELRFLSKATQPVRVMMKAAQEVARQIISGKVIKEIKPRDYSVAEARAARQAMDAIKKGESAQAARAKQNQLVQNQLTREAIAAKEEVAKALRSFKKIFRPDAKVAKTRNVDLVDAARSILAYYGLGKKGKAPTEYLEKLRAYNPDLYAELEPIILRAISGEPKTYRDLTMDEFRIMRDSVEALWFQSKRENEIMIEGKALDLNMVVGELNERLQEIGVPDEVPGERSAPSKRDRVIRSFYQAKAATRRIEHWADATDGPDGTGPFTKYIWRPIKDALNQYREMRNVYVKRYVELLGELDLPVQKIEAPELNYTFGEDNGGIGKAEVLGALMHTGNESNLRKLLIGRGWGRQLEGGGVDTSRWDAFVDRMIAEGKITKEDMDFVQAVWDLNEELKPMAQKAHHDLFGYYFREVEASPVTTPWGVYRGGYVPAKTDQFIVRDAQRNSKMEELESDFRQSMPSTGMGFTKGRVEYNKALSLDIRLMAKHIDDVIRFAQVQPAVRDVLKLLRKREFADTLTRVDPTAIEDMLIPWLNRAARQITSEPGKHKGVDKFWSAVRSRTGIGIMFANITNALQQVTGYFPAALKVQPMFLKSALAYYMGNSQIVTQEVSELSSFMRDRLQNQIFDIQDTMNDLLLNPSRYEQVQKWGQKHGYFLQTAFQNQVDVVTWTATFNQTLAELGADISDAEAQREAVQKADAAVRLTQSSLTAEDMAAFEVGTPFYKTLIQFSGYFNMLANLNANEYIKVMRDLGWRGNKGQLAYIYAMGFMLPMVVADAIVRSLGGQWDDEDDDGYLDEFMEWFFGSQVKGLAALVPFGSAAFTALTTAFNNKPYDDRMTTSPSVSTLEAATIGVGKTVINVASDDKDVTGKNVRDVLTLISLVTGIPVTVLGRPVGYVIDVEAGKTEPTGPVDVARGLVTGKASEASKE